MPNDDLPTDLPPVLYALIEDAADAPLWERLRVAAGAESDESHADITTAIENTIAGAEPPGKAEVEAYIAAVRALLAAQAGNAVALYRDEQKKRAALLAVFSEEG